MTNSILKRDIFDQIEMFLGDDSIIVLHGARQVGKTHILYFIQDYLSKKGKKTHYLDLEDSRNLEVLDGGVDSFLQYLENHGFSSNENVFILIDEIQYMKSPSPFLKLIADHHKNLRLIVSGSSSFDIKSKFTNSLVGRTVEFEVYPLSFKEFLRFKEVKTVFVDTLTNYYREYMAFGGYPKVVLENEIIKKEIHLQQIVDRYIKKDISDLAKIDDVSKFNNLLKVLASQSGQLINIAQLSNICDLASITIKKYLSILEETYIIKLVYPFSSSAKVEVVKSPKVFFYDTGLLQMLWVKKLQNTDIGNILETSVFSELVKKSDRKDINFWRTKNGTEIDFILDHRGEITPIEVKNNFSLFKKSKIQSFLEKYKIKDYKVVGLEGIKKSSNYIYPWEM